MKNKIYEFEQIGICIIFVKYVMFSVLAYGVMCAFSFFFLINLAKMDYLFG